MSISMKSPGNHPRLSGVLVRSINLYLANEEVPQRNKGDTDNDAEGYIPDKAPEITALQHHQRLLRESREGRKTTAEAHGQEQGPVAALGLTFIGQTLRDEWACVEFAKN